MLRVKRGRGGRGTNKGCPRAAVESKIAKLSLEITNFRHRVACRGQSCHRRTRCAIPLPRLGRHFPNVSQDICSAPSSGAGRPTLAVENSYAVYRGGGGQSSHGVACVPPSGCTMHCDSTQHIQKSRHPTLDHARIGTALSTTPNGDIPICTPLGLHSRVYVMSLKADHGEP